METSLSPTPGAPRAEPASPPDLLCVPADVTLMTEADYEKLVSALSTARGLLLSRRAGLNAADLRIRSLVSLAEKEAKRALVETRSRLPDADTNSPTGLPA